MSPLAKGAAVWYNADIMISQMRVHQKQIEKILREYPGENEAWDAWQTYHQYQVKYFQAGRVGTVIMLAVMLATGMISLAITGMGANWIALTVSLIALAMSAALEYYLYLYNKELRVLEEQTSELFAKAVAIETKPRLAKAQYWVDIAAKLVSAWVQRGRRS